MANFVLPRNRKQPVDDISHHNILIAGEKGAGKTSLAIQFPDHFMLECEVGNANHLDANYEDISTWDQILGYTTELEKAGSAYCKTLIIDEIALAYEYCCDFVRKEQKLAIDEKFEYDEWGIVRNHFRSWIKRIQVLPMGVVYTSHIDPFMAELRSGKKITKYQPRISKQCNIATENWIKVCGVMLFNPDSSRKLQLEGDETYLAYNKFPDHFINPATGKKHKEIPLGSSPQEAFNNFMLAYKNQLSVTSGGRPATVAPTTTPAAQTQPTKRTFAVKK